MTKTDRRQLNAVSWMRNPLGEYFVFGQFGSGKNRIVVTLAGSKSKPAILKAYRRYQGYVGLTRSDMPRR